MKRYRKRDHSYIGLNQSKEQIETHFNLQTSNKPYKVSEKIIFLGEIPRLNNFEAQATAFEDEFGNDDFVPDDSALAVILDHSIAVISGCAHAGICNTIEYAKKVTGINQVDFVLGGFHLKENNVQTQKTIDYFSIHNIGQINPSHCTQLPALSAFYEKFKIQQIKTGMQLFI
jgi:7,8-dihydropterin-6-yl-methyl-4-(beta-D-ribofuranosyl)aminobenzene 5'-phosphate synthase